MVVSTQQMARVKGHLEAFESNLGQQNQPQYWPEIFPPAHDDDHLHEEDDDSKDNLPTPRHLRSELFEAPTVYAWDLERRGRCYDVCRWGREDAKVVSVKVS